MEITSLFKVFLLQFGKYSAWVVLFVLKVKILPFFLFYFFLNVSNIYTFYIYSIVNTYF